MTHNRLFTWIALVILWVVSVACGGSSAPSDGASASALTPAEATALVENAIQGFAAGDYAAWSRDWSDAMKGAIPEDAFLAYRQQVIDGLGAYQSVESVALAPSDTAGYVRWVAVVNFAQGQMEFAFSFRQDGRLVEGVFPRQLG